MKWHPVGISHLQVGEDVNDRAALRRLAEEGRLKNLKGVCDTTAQVIAEAPRAGRLPIWPTSSKRLARYCRKRWPLCAVR
ncbi:MAG: hypothetical protein ACYDGN_11440 [Acidimicrobiales bacterium]